MAQNRRASKQREDYAIGRATLLARSGVRSKPGVLGWRASRGTRQECNGRLVHFFRGVRTDALRLQCLENRFLVLRTQKGGDVSAPLLKSQVTGFPCRHGKVRDIYDLGDQLVIVATDRISAFDWVLPTGIPDKGRVLTHLTLFWLNYLGVANHLLSADVRQMPAAFAAQADELEDGRCWYAKPGLSPLSA